MLGNTSPLSLTLGAFFSALIVLLLAAPALAQTRVTISQGTMRPIPTAFAPFAAAPGQEQMAQEVAQVIQADLTGSGLFTAVDPRAFLQDPASLAAQGPNFAQWRAVGAEALITGQVDASGQVEFRLWDVLGGQQLTGKVYAATAQNWRRVAHIAADVVYERLTGEAGYFDTRIVYVAETGPVTARTKQLAIMDQDGANGRALTDGGAMVLTPRFSPSAQLIAYMSYETGTPQVFLYALNTGRRELLGRFPGMTFAPRFSPDGRSVVMSLAQRGNTDIYVMDLASRQPRRLTSDPSIETAPSFSPDGQWITFESDRSGTQQVYVMPASGGPAKRITFGQGRYATPVWSPRGDLIAFTRLFQGQFYLGVIKPDGSGERLITQAYHVEGPTWAPNGRRIAYFKESGRDRTARVYTIDITGYDERAMPTGTSASDPAWSPPGSKK